MPLPVSLPQILDAHGRTMLEGLHTSLPGVVHKYDAATQTADVYPTCKAVWYDEDDIRHEDALPVIPNVPIAWPHGGGFFLTFPLAKGDEVLLVFSETSTGEWRETGQVSAPRDLTRHGLGSPVAIPARTSSKGTIMDSSDVNLRMGKDGTDSQVVMSGTEITLGSGAIKHVALGEPTDSNFAALSAALSAVASAIPSGAPITDGGKAAFTALASALSFLTVSATMVKAK